LRLLIEAQLQDIVTNALHAREIHAGAELQITRRYDRALRELCNLSGVSRSVHVRDVVAGDGERSLIGIERG
jgi:hypothetical protein